MPHLSKRPLENSVEMELVNSLKLVLLKITQNEEMENFLYSLLSKTEQLMLAKRLAIIVLLNEKVSESTIAGILNITRETVARIKLKAEMKNKGYEIALRKLEEEKILKQFKKMLLSLARYSIRRAAGGYVKPQIFD